MSIVNRNLPNLDRKDNCLVLDNLRLNHIHNCTGFEVSEKLHWLQKEVQHRKILYKTLIFEAQAVLFIPYFFYLRHTV